MIIEEIVDSSPAWSVSTVVNEDMIVIIVHIILQLVQLGGIPSGASMMNGGVESTSKCGTITLEG